MLILLVVSMEDGLIENLIIFLHDNSPMFQVEWMIIFVSELQELGFQNIVNMSRYTEVLLVYGIKFDEELVWNLHSK